MPLPEVEAETKGWTKRNNPRPLRAAVTRANVKGILVCGNIGRRGSSGWRRPPHSGAGSGTSPRDSRLHDHLISPCTHKMCSDCVCSPSLRFRYSTHGDSSCCLRAAPRRPRQARRRARARAPAPRGARVGGSRRRTQAGCRALWCFSFSSVAGRRPCLAPSLWSSLRAGRALASAASRPAMRARCTRRACVTGGSRRRSRARTSRVWCSLLLSSSLVPSLRARRSLDPPACRRGARASRAGARRTRRATRRARRVGSPSAERPRSSRSVFCARVVLFSSSLLSFRRSARGPPSIHPHAGGGARITSGRAAHATRDATRAARGSPSAARPRSSRSGFAGTAVLGFPGASPCSARAPAPFAPLPETAGGRGVRTTNGRATHAARGAAHAACGDAKGSPLSFVAVRGSRVFSVFRSSPHCAPRCSLAPRRGGALARAGTRRTRDLRAELAPRCVCVCGLFVPRSATWRGGPRARVRLCVRKT